MSKKLQQNEKGMGFAATPDLDLNVSSGNIEKFWKEIWKNRDNALAKLSKEKAKNAIP